MECGSMKAHICLLKQLEKLDDGTNTLELCFDSSYTNKIDEFFQDACLQSVFVVKDPSMNIFKSRKLSVAIFLDVLASVKAAGWIMNGSNAIVINEVVVRSFYLEKAHSTPVPVPSSQSPVRAPPIPARRHSRTPTGPGGIASDAQAAGWASPDPKPSIQGIDSPVPMPPKTTPPPPPIAQTVPAVEPLGGLTRDRPIIDSGRRNTKPIKSSKLLLQQMAAQRRKSMEGSGPASDVAMTASSAQIEPDVDNPEEPKVPGLSKTQSSLKSIFFSDDSFDLGAEEPAPPPAPLKPSDVRRGSVAYGANGGVNNGAVGLPSAFLHALTSNPGGQPKERQNSIRIPPPPVKTSLSADDMNQNSPYLQAPKTAPASSTAVLDQSNSDTKSPRTLRAPPPVPGSPSQPVHFTFDTEKKAGSDLDSTQGLQTVHETAEVDEDDYNPSEPEDASPATATGSIRNSVGNVYTSLLKSFGNKDKGASPSSSSSMPSAPPPPPPKRVSMLQHSTSLGDNATAGRAAPPPPPKRSNTISIDDSSAVGMPDEKNFHFYERNLQFFKKLKEEEERKKSLTKAKEDALSPDEAEALKQQRAAEEEREKNKTAHYQAIGRTFSSGGGGGGRGMGISLTGRGGRGRGSSGVSPSAAPPAVEEQV